MGSVSKITSSGEVFHQCELLTNINVSNDVNLQNQLSNQWLLLFLVISSHVMLGKGTIPIS